jgi:predicted transcriptional regulator
MIASEEEFRAVLNQLSLFHQGLQELLNTLSDKNPELLQMTRGSYEKRIEKLQNELANYAHKNPNAISWILQTVKTNSFVVGTTQEQEAIAA